MRDQVLRTRCGIALLTLLILPGLAGAQPARGRADFDKAVPAAEPPAAVAPTPAAPVPNSQRVHPTQPRPPVAHPSTPVRPAGPPVIIWDPQRDSGQRTQGATRPTSEAEARAATEAFYRTYLQIRAMGIPNATQRGRLRAHLSPALEAALVGAAQAEQAHRAASGPDEPPLHEGDLFSAAQEGARTAVVQGCEMAGDRAVCTVQLGRDEGGSRLEWQDMLTLVRTPLGWRLDDVAYGPQGAVGNFGTLRALLTVLVRQTDPRPPPPGATPPEGAPQRGSPQGALMPPPVDAIATSAVRDEAVTIFGIPIPGFVR